MCPFCFATVGCVVAGAVSTGGLAAFAVKMSRRKNMRNNTMANVTARRTHDVNQHDHQYEHCVAR
jgi:hypothetical protein